MSRADEIAVELHDVLNGIQLGAEAEEILEHGADAADRARVALAELPWCGGPDGLRALRLLEELEAEPPSRPTDPCPPPTAWDGQRQAAP